MKPFELFYPVKPRWMNQRFGENATPIYAQFGMKGHNGIDFQASEGTFVRAAHDGLVTFAGEDGASGYTIVVRTHDQRAYKGGGAFFKTLYCHLRKDGILVRSGQSVRVGDIIALSGNTGASTGPHLHFGLKPEQQGEAPWQFSNIENDNGFRGAIDPTPYFPGMYAEDYASIRARIHSFSLQLAALLRSRSA